jgi:hypothetical protein
MAIMEASLRDGREGRKREGEGTSEGEDEGRGKKGGRR